MNSRAVKERGRKMHGSNSSLATTENPHLWKVNNQVVTAKVIPWVQPLSSLWEVKTSKVWQSQTGWCIVRCLLLHLPCNPGWVQSQSGESGWAKPPAELITMITGISRKTLKSIALQMTCVSQWQSLNYVWVIHRQHIYSTLLCDSIVKSIHTASAFSVFNLSWVIEGTVVFSFLKNHPSFLWEEHEN